MKWPSMRHLLEEIKYLHDNYYKTPKYLEKFFFHTPFTVSPKYDGIPITIQENGKIFDKKK